MLFYCFSGEAPPEAKATRRDAGCGRSQDGENLSLILCLV
jgi:hypothetical protein